MDRRLRRTAVACLGCLTLVGCVAQQFPEIPVAETPAPFSPYAKNFGAPGATATYGAPAADASLAANARKSLPSPSAPAGDHEQQIRAILADLTASSPIDAAAQAQLAADLRQTDPTLWPMLVQTFRAGAAYRQKSAATPAADAPQPEVDAATAQVVPPLLPPVDAVGSSLRPQSGSTPGLSLPTQTLLNAALIEAQQKQAEQAAGVVPPSLKAEQASGTAREPPADVAATKTESAASSDAQVASPAASEKSWRQSVEAAIAALESSTSEPPHSAAEVSRHAWLRMLYLAAGRRDDALKPIAGISAAEQDFWTSQVYALATYLDTERVSDPARRSAEARTHLAKAESRLAEASTLTVRNLAFCTEVSSYGVYDRFKDYAFKPSQPLILYAEVENFRSEPAAKGYHTALRSSYQILDAQGRRVAENDLALTEEYCQNERRDYFIRYFLSVPERIYEGKYVLQLTIVDTLSQKIGQSTIDFTVGGEKK